MQLYQITGSFQAYEQAQERIVLHYLCRVHHVNGHGHPIFAASVSADNIVLSFAASLARNYYYFTEYTITRKSAVRQAQSCVETRSDHVVRDGRIVVCFRRVACPIPTLSYGYLLIETTAQSDIATRQSEMRAADYKKQRDMIVTMYS